MNYNREGGGRVYVPTNIESKPTPLVMSEGQCEIAHCHFSGSF